MPKVLGGSQGGVGLEYQGEGHACEGGDAGAYRRVLGVIYVWVAPEIAPRAHVSGSLI